MRSSRSGRSFSNSVWPMRRLVGEFTIELRQLAHFMAAGMIERALNRGQFDRQQQLFLVTREKMFERIEIMNERHLHRRRDVAERDQAIGRAELLGERMPIAEPIRRLTLRRLEGLHWIDVKLFVHCQRLRCTR